MNNSAHVDYQWGVNTDKPVPGDYDGDGKTDVAITGPRPASGTCSCRARTSRASCATVGLTTDIPVPGDYDGDGKTDVAIYRPSTGIWYVLLSSDEFVNLIVISGA